MTATAPVRSRALAFLRPSHRHTATSATLLLGVFALLSRVIGLLRDKYIAHTFGADPATDAYNVAFQLPDLISSLLIGGAASISFVTILTRYRERGQTEEGDRALSVILTTVTIVLTVALGLAEFLVPLYSSHFLRADPAVVALCNSMTRILLPGQLFFFLGGVLASVALVRKQFTYQALAPLVYTVGIIVGGLLLAHRLGIRSLAWGAFFGALLGPVCVNGYAALRAGARIRPAWDLRDPGLREWVRMSLPLMFGFTVVFMDQYILTYFAKQHAGDISRLLQAKRLFAAPIAVIGQAAGAASMPFFASLFSRGLHAEFARAVNRSVTRIVAVALLLTGALFALAGPIVDLLLRGGAFSRTDALETAALFAIFTLSLPFWAVQSLYARAFYAAGDTRTPMVGGTIVMLASLPIYWLLHREFGVRGLAWASDFAILLQTITLAVLAHLRGLMPLFGRAPIVAATSNADVVADQAPAPDLDASTAPDLITGTASDLNSPTAVDLVAPPAPADSPTAGLGLDMMEIARALAAALLGGLGATLTLRLLPGHTAAASHLAALATLSAGGAAWLGLSFGALALLGSPLPRQMLRRQRA